MALLGLGKRSYHFKFLFFLANDDAYANLVVSIRFKMKTDSSIQVAFNKDFPRELLEDNDCQFITTYYIILTENCYFFFQLNPLT